MTLSEPAHGQAAPDRVIMTANGCTQFGAARRVFTAIGKLDLQVDEVLHNQDNVDSAIIMVETISNRTPM